MDTANVEQKNLTVLIKDFVSKTKLQNTERKELKKEVLDSTLALLQGRYIVYQTFEIGLKNLRPKESEQGEGLKILTPNQILKRLPIALAQIKAGNNSESLLNEIREIVYSLYRSKEITKKVYNSIIKSIKV